MKGKKGEGRRIKGDGNEELDWKLIYCIQYDMYIWLQLLI